MRLKKLADETRVFMNPPNYKVMLESAVNQEAALAMATMARVGCQIGELDFGPKDIRESSHPNVDLLFVTIQDNADDGDTDGEQRDAWMPHELYEDLEEHRQSEGYSEETGYFEKSKRTMSRYINKSTENAVRRTGNEDYQYVTAHDFRAYFATNMVLREGVDEEIVMKLGGWNSREALDPYLNTSFDDLIQAELVEADVIEEETDDTSELIKQLCSEFGKLHKAVGQIDPTVSVQEPSDDVQAVFDDF